MLDTFPKDFSQVATSQRYFSKFQLPKCAIFQVSTSQVYPSRSNLPLACSSLGARPPSNPSRIARPPLQPAGPLRSLPNLWEFAVWEIAHLGSFHLINCHLGSRPCENACEKVPNTNKHDVL